MKLSLKFYFLWLSVIAWLRKLLFLSFQTGNGTVETSGRLAMMVSSILSVLGIEMSYSVIHGILRTVAHIVVFLIFGGLLEAAVMETMKGIGERKGKVGKTEAADGTLWKMRGLPTVMLICAGVAILSEVFKIYIPGRHLDWPEVGLNVVGAWIGGVGMYVVEWLYKKRKHA